MYYNKRKLLVSVTWVVLGIILFILDAVGIIDNSIFSGMGGGFIGIGAIQIYKNLKYHSNEEYKEKVDIESTDERNRYIRMKAWSWAGYLFIIGAAIVSIVLYVTNQIAYGQILSYCICTVLVIYWIAYLVLQKKN